MDAKKLVYGARIGIEYRFIDRFSAWFIFIYAKHTVKNFCWSSAIERLLFGKFTAQQCSHQYSECTVLWSAVYKIEKAKKSQLEHEIELVLPVELSREQNINLVCEYVKNHFVERGMCADICIHDKIDENPHTHIIAHHAAV